MDIDSTPSAHATAQFVGTSRFLVERELGRGAMGVVYRAYDLKLESRVALKVLRELEPMAIYRFKHEFRSLADITHPNLVTLYELISAEQDWFFTMELIDGVGLLEFVRGAAVVPSVEPGTSSTLREGPEHTAATGDVAAATSGVVTTPNGVGTSGHRRAPPLTLPAQFDRLRAVLTQLAAGLGALHAQGILHRDVKPSNVLVTEQGRVVLLDFGIVTNLATQRLADETRQLVGTPGYMAPEQCSGERLGEPCDWYALGALMYEALTGRRPFVGASRDVIDAKQSMDPRPASALNPHVPVALDQLCMHLLSRDPLERATATDVLSLLGTDPGCSPAHIGAGVSTIGDMFVGREPHLAALLSTFDATRRGATASIFMRGASGVGKSALVNHFLDGVRDAGSAIVLGGRCYERESVPYKALDSLIDSLCRYLLSLPRADVERLLPPNILALTRLFPVLRRVEAIAEAPADAPLAPDPQEIRRRAIGALRELFIRLASRDPIVMWIDDVQWGDEESAWLLSDLLHEPGAPRAMCILSFRTGDTQDCAFLRALGMPGSATTMEVAPFSDSEGQMFALALLRDRPDAGELAATLAREAGGNAFFVAELAHHLLRRETAAVSGKPGNVTLEEALGGRVDELPAATQRLLEIVAVSGRPLPQSAAARAADLDPADRGAVAQLRSQRLIRTRPAADRDEIETYHDRIRETIVGRLSRERRCSHHMRLAVVLEAAGAADAETLAAHFEEAGAIERAVPHWISAAQTASSALAFDRAAALYRRVLALRQDPHDGGALEAALGEALANAGRGREAADALLAAAKKGNDAFSLECQRRAAEQLLRSGHIDEGLLTLSAVLDSVGMKLSKSPRRALARLIVRRAYLRMRGLGFRERDASQVSPAALTRIDIMWSVTVGLGMVDTIRSTDFETRHVLDALRCGELGRIARALGAEAISVAATGGRRGRLRSIEVSTAAEEVADRVGEPLAVGLARGGAGMAAYQVGDFARARERVQIAVAAFRDHCTGVALELSTAELIVLWTEFYLGRLADFTKSHPRLLRAAQARGDLYTATNLSTGLPSMVWLVCDQPQEATRAREEMMARWPRGDWFHLQHYWELYARVLTSMYCGDVAAAVSDVETHWSSMEKSFLLHVRMVRLEAYDMRARCRLAAAADSPAGRARLLRAARRDARRVGRNKILPASALESLLRGGIAVTAGDADGSKTHLERAEQQFANAEMALHVAITRYRRGQLLGGDEGSELKRVAQQWLASEGVVRPDRFVALLAPGTYSS